MNSSRVLCIALDAAERDLVVKWTREGELPNLAALSARGIQGAEDVLPGFGSGANWPAFATSQGPARHGRYYMQQMKPGTYEFYKASESTLRAPPFWRAIAEAGHSACVINVPHSPMARHPNAVELLDWAVHRAVTEVPRSHPPEFGAEVQSAYGGDPLRGRRDPESESAEAYEDFVAGLERRAELKGRQAAELIRSRPFNFMLTTLDETHRGGHHVWHLHDPTHPRHDAAVRARIGDPMLRLYRAVDRAVGEIVAAAGADTRVLVVGITGMAGNYTGNWAVGEILQRLYAQRRKSGGSGAAGLARSAWKLLPHNWRIGIRRRIGSVQLANPAVFQAERARQRAFAMPHNDIAGAVRLNLVGREPEGKVRSEDFDSTCAEIGEAFLELRNLDTGRPVVERVVKVRDITTGPYLDEMADVLAIWNKQEPLLRIGSERLGEISGGYRGKRSGDHTAHGFFFAAGPGIGQGSYAQPFTVMDFGATLAGWLGVELPQVEGRPLALSV